MSKASVDELKRAVERQHGGAAVFNQAVPVSERSGGLLVWRGIVYIFDLQNHPAATRVYAWSSAVEGSAKRYIFTVLHVPPVGSPLAAVRAAIEQEHHVCEETSDEPADHSEDGRET